MLGFKKVRQQTAIKTIKAGWPKINFMARANSLNANLERTHFDISRSAEYFDPKELQAQTGQSFSKFGDVVLKKLIDNALDACESADDHLAYKNFFVTNES